MSRYIDAELIDFSRLKNDFDRARAKIIIMGQPTADVVEVVRCRDCKWWHREGCAFRKDSVPNLPNADDYCSHGERGEEDTE